MPTPPRIAIPIPTSHDAEYNRQSWPAYAESVRQSGGDPLAVPLDTTPSELTALIGSCQAILLPGSPADVDPNLYGHERLPESAAADPARQAVDLRLLEDAHHHRKPIFTICFGTQMLNVSRGGTLIQDLSILPVNHKAGRAVSVAHSAAIAPDSLLGAILAEATPDEAPPQEGFLRLPINSSHHQALATPGEGLRITARCPQDAVIEAVEDPTPRHFVLGVQWHPERSVTTSPASRALFNRFVEQARGWSLSV